MSELKVYKQLFSIESFISVSGGTVINKQPIESLEKWLSNDVISKNIHFNSATRETEKERLKLGSSGTLFVERVRGTKQP